MSFCGIFCILYFVYKIILDGKYDLRGGNSWFREKWMLLLSGNLIVEGFIDVCLFSPCKQANGYPVLDQ